MIEAAALEFLNPETIISAAGPWALVVVGAIVFAETGLLFGFILPGDTLLVISGLLTHTNFVFGTNVWIVATVISGAAIVGGEVGYWIGEKGGKRLFEQRESGLFSVENVQRTNAFFERFGAIAVILARFVPIIRTFAPVAAGIGHMNRRKYSLYNILGGAIWGYGLTLLGFVIGYVTPLADFVKSYIDFILLAAVLAAVLPTAYHYWQGVRKAKAANAETVQAAKDAAAQTEAEFGAKPEDL
ncbi:MAG TPA: VTT domain-containing protein [Microbacteriaceae bacterium]|nr:VTT domain-containing protein [Microbacteriaceae bacterium]